MIHVDRVEMPSHDGGGHLPITYPLKKQYDAENRDSMGRSEAISRRARVDQSSPEGSKPDEVSTHEAQDREVRDPNLQEKEKRGTSRGDRRPRPGG